MHMYDLSAFTVVKFGRVNGRREK